jgi:transposase
MYVMKLLDRQNYEFQWKKPILRIGIDGKAVKKHQCVTTITNLDENSLIGVLAATSQQKIIDELLKIDVELRLAVREVALDMDNFYISLVQVCFPNARLVVDHFHVIQWAIQLIDEQRRIIQQLSKQNCPIKQLIGRLPKKLTKAEFAKLEAAFSTCLELKNSWLILQELRKIYWQKNWRSGDSQLRKVIWLCNQSCIPEMIRLARTLKNHRERILNYYISKLTNAYTEGIHNRFETIRRDHCGIDNIERFSKRLLFCFLPFSTVLENFLPQII